MISFVFQKILNKKWLVISLLLGNLLMVAVAAANPMYSQAVLQKNLTQALSDQLVRYDEYPGTIVVENNFSPSSKSTVRETKNTSTKAENTVSFVVLTLINQ